MNNWWDSKQRREHGTWLQRKSHPVESDFLVFVPYVNNRELLEKAIQSLKPLWRSLIVIDQSEEDLVAQWANEIAGVYRVGFRSISFTQMMNWATEEAFSRRVRLLGFVHSDAECVGDEVPEAIMSFARGLLTERIGVTFTNYDAFAVFNVDALQVVGPWDESFRWYFADNDYYYRLRLLGWSAAEFGGSQVRHIPSQTLQADARIRGEVNASWEWTVRHYEHKWGGSTGHERFTVPYDGKP